MSISMLLVAGAVVAVYVIASALWSGYLGPFYYVRLKWRNAISRETYLERDAILQQWNTFYKGLSTDGKGKFMRRMNRLIAERTFEGRQGLEVTEEMKIVIGSALTQLTFGLEYYDIYGFGLVHIYPEQFYSGMAKAELKGGTTPHGRIMLSWKDTKAGFADPHDRINLALHEMAHALKLSVFHSAEFDDQFGAYLGKWLKVAETEYRNIRKGNDSFLRKYAGTNRHELFAVAVEHFFEAPEDMARELPKVYDHLCVLLNLDPRNAYRDYQVSAKLLQRVLHKGVNVPVYRKAERSDRQASRPRVASGASSKNRHDWALNVLAAGLVLGLPVFIFLLSGVVADLAVKAMLIAVLAGFGVVASWRLWRDKYFQPLMFLAFIVLGFAPLLGSMLLVVDRLVVVETMDEEYLVTATSHYNNKMVLELKGGAYEEMPDVRTYNRDTDNVQATVTGPSRLIIHFNRGVLGFRHVGSRTYVRKSPS